MLFNFFEKEMPTRVKFKLSSNKCYLNILFFLSLCHYFVYCIDNVTEPTNKYHVTTATDISPNNRFTIYAIFKCPEQFGYYPDKTDCSKYYVCVFGDALHETCTGGLYFSSELQTCDWPRNVECANDLDNKHSYNNDNNEGFNENLDHNIEEDVDVLYDNTDEKYTEEEDYIISNENENDSNTSTASGDNYQNNYNNNNNNEKDREKNQSNIYNQDLDIQRSKVLINNNNNLVGGIIGRSANGLRHETLGDTTSQQTVSNDNKLKELHGNKVNIEIDPQQPSYDEAIASVVDENGGIHIHDGPGGTFALPHKNVIIRDSGFNYNDKDSAIIERIADRRPRVKVRRIRKKLTYDLVDVEDSDKSEKNDKNDKNEKSLKNQYIPVIVMDKEDMNSKEEKVRRLRSDNFRNFDIIQDSVSSSAVSHFQNQRHKQQQHFKSQNKPKESFSGGIPIAAIESPDNKKSGEPQNLEFRGFVTTRNDDGTVIAIPIFRDMPTNGESQTQKNRRKRVRVVQRVVHRPIENLDEMVIKSKPSPKANEEPARHSRPSPRPSPVPQSPLPRILVPERNQWQPHLPFYGPSLTQLKKIQILPPIGPLPGQKDSTREDSNPFNKQQIKQKSKPAPNEHSVQSDHNENNWNIEKRVSSPELNNSSSVRTHSKIRPDGTNAKAARRTKKKTKLVRSNQTSRAPVRQTIKPIELSTQTPETTISSVSESTGPQPRIAPQSHESQRIKLTRNGKRLGPKDNNALQTTSNTTQSPSTASTSRKPIPRVVITNTGSPPINKYDYFDFPYFDDGSNHTVNYFTINEPKITTFSPTTTPTTLTTDKQSIKRKQSRVKKGSSVPPSRPEPLYPTPVFMSSATKCTNSKCRLPDCFCGGTTIPNNYESSQIPQMIMITFDDSVNDLNWEIYEEIFNNRHNPNGCPILGTFYVSHEWTDYGQVQTLYSNGHEMASHSITHSFGEKFSKQKWLKEVNGQREILHLYGGVHLADVRGMRAPFLQGGGNKQFEMLFEANFTYDSTMPVFENSPPFWPYTLDYAINHECMIAPCPTKSFPGVWEIGMVMWQDLRGGRCSMGDACSNPLDEDGVYEMLIKNFNRHYNSNRAPFGLYYHSAWFNTIHHRRGFMRFIDQILTKKDVYFVTKWQLIQWMREPTTLSSITSFKPWLCNFDDRPPPCNSPTVCNVGSKSGSRFLKTCQPCPTSYPWVGNTGFASTTT